MHPRFAVLLFSGWVTAVLWQGIEALVGSAITPLGYLGGPGGLMLVALLGIGLLPSLLFLFLRRWLKSVWLRTYCMLVAIAVPVLATIAGLLHILNDPKGPLFGSIQVLIFLPAIPVVLVVFTKQSPPDPKSRRGARGLGRAIHA